MGYNSFRYTCLEAFNAVQSTQKLSLVECVLRKAARIIRSVNQKKTERGKQTSSLFRLFLNISVVCADQREILVL